ncbi:hypothetical protein GHT09_007396 [Marmota monax]|uniref:Uncharacterized protein n=1 Tax=Marmota monax TaxID=9995 RepID=A0A834QPY9_MARMO|nr:hypothetical protein GHT09_007396 [Marmota monax]
MRSSEHRGALHWEWQRRTGSPAHRAAATARELPSTTRHQHTPCPQGAAALTAPTGGSHWKQTYNRALSHKGNQKRGFPILVPLTYKRGGVSATIPIFQSIYPKLKPQLDSTGPKETLVKGWPLLWDQWCAFSYDLISPFGEVGR